MKAHVLLRKLHHWGAALIILQMGLVIGAGLLLLLKKEFAWIQPPTIKGEAPGAIPARSVEELYRAAVADPRLGAPPWGELARVDFQPDKGIVKFVAPNGWEAQVDGASGEVLQVAYRRSDLIESLHDGSFFANWTKLYVFLPSGLVLFGLWASGVYMFTYTRLKLARKARRREVAFAREAT